ncbi:MAG: hypothetical protein H7Z41_15285 [Cytophagales bacterium]|nr:hypothetical protein [Armatimonadota bacterium]
MEIYPRDLGTENYLGILRRRLSPIATHPNSPGTNAMASSQQEPKRVRSRRVKRYWTRGLNLTEAETEKVSSLVWNSVPGGVARVISLIFSIYLGIGAAATLAGGAYSVTLILFLAWVALIFGMMASPRQALRKAHQRALDTMEIESLLPTTRGRLETTYLNLVRDARQTEVPSAAAQEDIRVALRAMGETITQLPAEPVRPQDADTLAQNAHALRDQAAAETDAVVRDSLLRQAVTLEKQMGSANASAKSARRAQALRREVRVQMDALRSALLSFNDGALAAQQTGAVTTALSDAMQQVATEAQAVTLARQELADQEIAGLLGTPPVAPVARPAAQPVAKPLLTPQQPVAETPPQQQVGQGRQWWRNT